MLCFALFHRQPIDHALIDGARDSDGAVTPLPVGGGPGDDEDARLVLKHPRDGVAGEARQRRDLCHCVHLLPSIQSRRF